MQSGEVIEFVDPEIELLQERIAARLGYRLRGHRLELYGVPLRRDPDKVNDRPATGTGQKPQESGPGQNDCAPGGEDGT
jgi:hypothetical protein